MQKKQTYQIYFTTQYINATKQYANLQSKQENLKTKIPALESKQKQLREQQKRQNDVIQEITIALKTKIQELETKIQTLQSNTEIQEMVQHFDVLIKKHDSVLFTRLQGISQLQPKKCKNIANQYIATFSLLFFYEILFITSKKTIADLENQCPTIYLNIKLLFQELINLITEPQNLKNQDTISKLGQNLKKLQDEHQNNENEFLENIFLQNEFLQNPQTIIENNLKKFPSSIEETKNTEVLPKKYTIEDIKELSKNILEYKNMIMTTHEKYNDKRYAELKEYLNNTTQLPSKIV